MSYIPYPQMYGYGYYQPFFSLVLPVLAAVIAIAGGLALYFLFVRRPNTFQGTAAGLHDALTFRVYYTERLLRVLYCITVAALTVYSVFLLFSNVFAALALLIIGNVLARIIFEFALLLLVLCRNTQEINRKLGQQAAPQAPADDPQDRTCEQGSDTP